jgi:hypothetical protein
MTAIRNDRRSQSVFQPLRFRGTRDLKFSPAEQRAIRRAETGLGYGNRPSPGSHPGAGLGKILLAIVGLLLLTSLLITVTQSVQFNSAPRSEYRAPSSAALTSSGRMASRSPLRRNARAVRYETEESPVTNRALPASGPVIYTNVGDQIVALTPRQADWPAKIPAKASVDLVPEHEPPDQPPTFDHSVIQPAMPASSAPRQPQTNSGDGPAIVLGSLRPAPPDSTWHRFASRDSAPADGRWHRFGALQFEAASAESGQNLQPPGEPRQFKHHQIKRHSIFRRVLGDIGQVLEGVTEGVAAPLQGMTEGFQGQPLPSPYAQPTALPWWTDPEGFQVPPQEFLNFAPPGAERRIDP